MYIRNKPAAACYKLLLGLVSLVLSWYLFSQYGYSAFRLFPTWILLISALYFLISATILAINARKFTGKNLMAVLEGMIILAFWLMSGIALASAKYHFYLPELEDWLVLLLCLFLPILVTLDWVLFVKKGRWRPMMPFYGLVLPVSYMSVIIFTADLLPSNIDFRYPLEMLNAWDFGIWPMLSYAVATASLVLICGYILYLIDFALSGKLAKYIVLPHLRVIEVDENGQEVKSATEPQQLPLAKSAKSSHSIKVEATKPKPTDSHKDTSNPKPTHKTTQAKAHKPPKTVKVKTIPTEKLASKTTSTDKSKDSSKSKASKNTPRRPSSN